MTYSSFMRNLYRLWALVFHIELVVWILVVLLWVVKCFLVMLLFFGRVKSMLVSQSHI